MGGLFRLFSEEGTGRSRSPPRPLLAVPNATGHPSTASVPTIDLLYNGPLLYGINCGAHRANTALSVMCVVWCVLGTAKVSSVLLGWYTATGMTGKLVLCYITL